MIDLELPHPERQDPPAVGRHEDLDAELASVEAWLHSWRTFDVTAVPTADRNDVSMGMPMVQAGLGADRKRILAAIAERDGGVRTGPAVEPIDWDGRGVTKP